MSRLRGPLVGMVNRFARRLRFPTLFWVTATLFVLDLLIPDLVPLADEILLGLLTLLLGGLRRRGERVAAPPQDGPP